MITKLTSISQKARKEPTLIFTSLYHHITDVNNLRSCYMALNAHELSGIDRAIKEAYCRNCDENLHELSANLKRMGYHPWSPRRAPMPKVSHNMKDSPGINLFNNQIVELSFRRVIDPIYAALFENSNNGNFSEQGGYYAWLSILKKTIRQKHVNYIMKGIITGPFDSVGEAWMMKILKHRIGDPRVLRMINRMLKAGIMNNGAHQDAILSPLLWNIYLHYVLDCWLEDKIRTQGTGKIYYYRFLKNLFTCYQNHEDSLGIINHLNDRLEGFSLELAIKKIIKCHK
ncbi:MAG: hypothetical protein ACMUIP_00365 [bacterium]